MTDLYIVVVDNGDTEPELWAFASDGKAEEFASARSDSASVTALSVISDDAADELIAAERQV